ncbi:hypothetical protein ACP4OV_018458 [Aristida adscensionis]
MVRKKQQAGGALTSLFGGKQQEAAGAAPPPRRPSSSPPSWQWPSCGQPRTLSFRHERRPEEEATAAAAKLQGYRTMNSAYLPDSGAGSCFSGSFASVESESFSTATEEAAPAGAGDAGDEAEAVVRALRSDRLFFDGPAAPCILAAAGKPAKNKAVDDDGSGNGDMAAAAAAAFGGATAMTVESRDPYRDFRESMEAMVLSGDGGGGGGKDWRWLEEMLGWYLRANGKATHGLIVGAFVDLLVSLSAGAGASPSSSSSTPTNFSSASTDCDSSTSL